MKTPLNPIERDLAAATGKQTRRMREEESRLAKAGSSRESSQTLQGCNGTETLAMIERALVRLTAGTYGICLSCGADISVGRLDQNPTVETCATCQETASFRAH